MIFTLLVSSEVSQQGSKCSTHVLWTYGVVVFKINLLVLAFKKHVTFEYLQVLQNRCKGCWKMFLFRLDNWCNYRVAYHRISQATNREFLICYFHNYCTDQGGTQARHPNSMNLSKPDYFLWWYMKSSVYVNMLCTAAVLEDCTCATKYSGCSVPAYFRLTCCHHHQVK